ncbi:ribonuclease YeeF family protein [Metabacillus arenae]|uniref:LXG domain-containing protein n=1 Tax=Metabacillus arenae TaxID=2771434 RepID=A0A926NBI3_9BACI|nr:LXG domain-containing protein [Metabacillus arenae]MBD1380444.1 LXG domain-containing protein [Metabacillus arenae]
MKTLDAQSLHNGIDGLLNKIKSQMDQLKQLEGSIEDFSGLNDSFKGKGGTAVRSFYQDWHVPILSFHYHTLKSYDRVLTNLKMACSDLESDTSGFISQSFLNGDLTNGLNKAKTVTADLVDDANTSIDSVSDIVSVERLDDQYFHNNIQRANKEIDKTIEDLVTFDTTQTNELTSVEQDIQMMKSYISEIQGMFNSGSLSVDTYNSDQLKEKPNYSKLNEELLTRTVFSFGDAFTSPFDYINQKMSFGDTLLAGYQFASSGLTLAAARKMKVHYFGGKPTLWQKIRGNYYFSVKSNPAWTSKSKHSAKLAKWLRDFQKAPAPSNRLMKGIQNFVKSYQSPAHLYKHVAGYPKDINRMSGKEFMKKTQIRMTTGTKEVLGRTITNNGFAKIGSRVPGLGVVISAVANTGEAFSPQNQEKPISERVGRAVGGFTADMVAIGAGAKLGAAIGSFGGPVGIIVGGSIGAFAGGLTSSKIGDAAKDVGGKIFKEVGKGIGKAGEKLKNSISSWFN